ncbi:PEP-CTERM sorting domain-containing protein [Singulisphaera sp. GP187]
MFTGTVTSLTASTVPEPSSATLVCLAAAGCLVHSRRRQERSD